MPNTQIEAGATFRVNVPASTSNIGPGFDCLGLALDLVLEARLCTVVATPDAAAVTLRAGPVGWPAPADDLLVRALGKTPQALLRAGLALELTVSSQIPMRRGLGSSGAAVAAGLLLADAIELELSGARACADDGARLARGIELEGHPDNVTASLLSGLTLCVPVPNGQPVWKRWEPSKELGFAALWTDAELTTTAARAALPPSVAHADAVHNARNLPLVVHGLATARRDAVELARDERLHVPYRLPLIKGAQAAIAAAHRAGAWLATISGAGSALFAVAPTRDIDAVARAMRSELARENDTTAECVGGGVVDAVCVPPRARAER